MPHSLRSELDPTLWPWLTNSKWLSKAQLLRTGHNTEYIIWFQEVLVLEKCELLPSCSLTVVLFSFYKDYSYLTLDQKETVDFAYICHIQKHCTFLTTAPILQSQSPFPSLFQFDRPRWTGTNGQVAVKSGCLVSHLGSLSSALNMFYLSSALMWIWPLCVNQSNFLF